MEKILEDLLRSLEESNSTYMLTGAILMQFYGEPRTTGDIDVIAEQKDMKTLSARLKENGFITTKATSAGNLSQLTTPVTNPSLARTTSASSLS